MSIAIARPEGQVNQEINVPDDLLAVENTISEVILPPPSPGMYSVSNLVVPKQKRFSAAFL